MSICCKIIIQIYAKIGGEPWTIEDFPFSEDSSMIVGIDVFHKTPDKKKSLMAFCATINKELTRFWSAIKAQGSGQEISNTLQDCMIGALHAFKDMNKVFPKKVIIYRDGVGEGQRKTLMGTEVTQILAAFKTMKLEDEIKMMFVLVDKRITTKIFSNANNKIENVAPGTVLDNLITSPDSYEFYMVSQRAKQGAASPTHYYILYDAIKEDPSKIQLLTYKLCYMYYNVSGSIRVPAPIQNAHRLAALIGERQVARDEDFPFPDKHMEDIKTLYFL